MISYYFIYVIQINIINNKNKFMKQTILTIIFLLITTFSFGQKYYEPVDTTEFTVVDTFYVTHDAEYHYGRIMTYAKDYEGDGIALLGKATKVEKLVNPIIKTFRYNKDKSLVYFGTHNNRQYVFKAYHFNDRTVLEQIMPINRQSVIVLDYRYNSIEHLD